MDFTMLNEYFVLVVMVACLIVGYIIKHASIFKKVPNNDIPVILAIVGAIMNTIVSGLAVESIVYGALMGLASTGMHQAFVNWLENKGSKE